MPFRANLFMIYISLNNTELIFKVIAVRSYDFLTFIRQKMNTVTKEGIVFRENELIYADRYSTVYPHSVCDSDRIYALTHPIQGSKSHLSSVLQ